MGSGQSLGRRGAGFSVHGYVVPLEYIFLAFLIEFTQREEGIPRPDRNLTLGPYIGALIITYAILVVPQQITA